MSQSQYIEKNSLCKNQARMHAALLVALMAVYMLSANTAVLYILVYDFLMRIYMAPHMSPIYLISTFLVKITGLKREAADESAKEFASHVGLTLLFAALGAELLGEMTIAYLLVGCLSIWKIAEATKDVCFACKFYELLKSRNIELESL
ncbi:DUF4395 domain-containing protein [Sulfurimonas sp.]|jgi:hypothetical protein|uniref:DUF4395 domain-containing protein n=1 Tax=Sulfurimonas sp. TaxID=2022749 RepID=UPI002A36A207|nr:DUF4395 domain-containing protein [Sulfurimonas sp.]MDY0122755.1 DUF4395 domain-containing protein [Sulfurimonas sp.]